MKPAPRSSVPPDDIEQTAALWVLRRDRGLTATEQDELSLWLALDARHGEALASARWGWDELDRLTGLQTSIGAVADPDLLAPKATAKAASRFRRRIFWGSFSLAAAAAVAFGIFLTRSNSPADFTVAPTPNAVALTAPCEHRVLEDGSIVDLNRGARIDVQLTAHERRVRLLEGEANFHVAKDAARPFVVNAGDFEVRAIGTVFNVELHPAGADVVVTEGRVRLQRTGSRLARLTHETPEAYLNAGQLGELRQAIPAAQVNTLTPTEVEERIAWQPRMLDFNDAPLSEILAKFNRRNPVKLRIADAQLNTVRLSATFRSDNVEGFVRLMESDFAMRAERRSDREIVLWRAP